jgi:dihydrofolate synthase/folylpolyglutamate synthase
MDYTGATDYLDSFTNLERGALDRQAREAISLDSVRALAARLGHPERGFPSLHVAGTKGKGSTCAFAAAALRAQGLRVGLYTSPHLSDIRERIRIDDADISQSAFARLLTDMRPALDAMLARPIRERRPTYFEILTHLAFLWFAEERVDAAVVEVGLGGRLDATTILQPDVCGIANISYDHTAILGETLTLIAGEKAGIFKTGVPALSAPQVSEARAALERAAQAAGAPLTILEAGRDFGGEASAVDTPWPRPRGWTRLNDGRLVRAELNLRGAHQVENWALATRLAETFLARRGGRLGERAVVAGARDVVWPGRLEEFRRGGVSIFLDGAHNAASLQTILSEGRSRLPRARALTCVFGCARDKDVPGMLALLRAGPHAPNRVIFTDSANPRGLPPGELGAQFDAHADMCPDSSAALRRAMELSAPDGVVLVTGSLYLVGKLRAELARE